MRRAWSPLLAVGVFLSSSTMRGQDAASLVERLHAADAGSALDAADMKAWHLKMTVQLFDRKGEASDQGTIEEWWNSPELDRREYKTKGYTATEIRSGRQLYRTKGSDVPPYYLELLRQQVVHPISVRNTTAAELRKVHADQLELDCIGLPPTSAKGLSPLGFDPTYCVVAGGVSLRITLGYRIQEIVRDLLGQFQGKEVAVGATESANNMKVATEHVESLSSGAAPGDTFAVTAETPEVDPPMVSAGAPGKVVRGDLLSGRAPVYPVMAKVQHVASAIVLVRAIVAVDGHVRSVAVISSTNPVFEGAATDAVRQWKYKPSTRDDQPVEMESVVVVHFETATP